MNSDKIPTELQKIYRLSFLTEIDTSTRRPELYRTGIRTRRCEKVGVVITIVIILRGEVIALTTTAANRRHSGWLIGSSVVSVCLRLCARIGGGGGYKNRDLIIEIDNKIKRSVTQISVPRNVLCLYTV